jgi:hypothetical protein
MQTAETQTKQDNKDNAKGHQQSMRPNMTWNLRNEGAQPELKCPADEPGTCTDNKDTSNMRANLHRNRPNLEVEKQNLGGLKHSVLSLLSLTLFILREDVQGAPTQPQNPA